MSRRGVLGLIAFLIALPVAEAGIVVLRDRGTTIVGTIDPVRDVTSEHIIIHRPEGEPGEIRVERYKVRWFDATANRPTDAYWERFHDEPIEQRWEGARKAWDAARDTTFDPVPIPEPSRQLLGQAMTQPARFTLDAPLGWKVRMVDEITIAETDPAPSGYAPRVHAFSVPTPRRGDPAVWVEEELRALPELAFALEELSLPRNVGRGADHELLTRTTVRMADGVTRDVRALRRVCVRPDVTVIVAAYACVADWSRLERLFRRSLGSLKVSGDR